MPKVCEKDHDDVREENPVLIGLSPHLAPIEEMLVRPANDSHIVPLVAHNNVDAVMANEREVTNQRDAKPEHSQDYYESVIQTVDDSILNAIDYRRGGTGILFHHFGQRSCHLPLFGMSFECPTRIYSLIPRRHGGHTRRLTGGPDDNEPMASWGSTCATSCVCRALWPHSSPSASQPDWLVDLGAPSS